MHAAICGGEKCALLLCAWKPALSNLVMLPWSILLGSQV